MYLNIDSIRWKYLMVECDRVQSTECGVTNWKISPIAQIFNALKSQKCKQRNHRSHVLFMGFGSTKDKSELLNQNVHLVI